MDADTLKHAFEPLFTTKSFGVGLGLAFARRVTEALGGGIEISSPPAGEVAERQLSGTLVELRVSRSPERPETQAK